ncbi:Acyltransferase-like protein 1 [Elsinoe fawcettii]|nr:Acyltransferase-like protein 1 [Elsinoe fawcettii]
MADSAQESLSLWQRVALALLKSGRLLRFLVPWVTHLLVADLALSALLPAATLFPDWTYDVSSRIAESVWRGIQRICEDKNQANIIQTGDELPAGESAIVVANHVDWTDFYLVQHLAVKAGMLSRCRWFAKQQLRWVPFLGWGLWAMGMPLVSRRWTEDKQEMDRVFHGVIARKWPMWLIAYSEGTRYTPQKYAESVAWCKAHDKPIMKHTLYPRVKGFVAAVQNLRKAAHVKAVYDVTIAYAKGNKFMAPPTFLETIFTANLGKKYKMYVHVDRHELASLPESSEELSTWLEQRWVEKGDRLEAVKKQLTQA